MFKLFKKTKAVNTNELSEDLKILNEIKELQKELQKIDYSSSSIGREVHIENKLREIYPLYGVSGREITHLIDIMHVIKQRTSKNSTDFIVKLNELIDETTNDKMKVMELEEKIKKLKSKIGLQ